MSLTETTTSGFSTISTYERLYTGIRLLRESAKGYCRLLECVRQGRHVAVKVLKEEYLHSEIHRQLIRKEFEIAASLYHSSIVSVVAFDDIPNYGPGIVMEYIEGVTLSDFIQSGQLTYTRAREILFKLIEALQYLHSRDIVHRDIKPSNIMVSVHGTHIKIKIIDFGLSSGLRYDALDFPAGTRSFSAPEQFEANAIVDRRADIYSLGRIIQTMIPRHRTIWHTLAAKCCNPDVGKRPESVEIVRKMFLRRYNIQRIVISLIFIVIIITALIISLLNRQDTSDSADDLTSIPLPVTDTTITNVSKDSYPPHISDMPKNIDNVPSNPEPIVSDANISLEDRVFSKASEVARQQFAWELASLDTVIDPGYYSLLAVGHWKWRAHNEIKKWLATQMDEHSPYFDDMMNLATRTVDNYDKEHFVEHNAAQAEAAKRYQRRTGMILGALTSYSFTREDGRIETKKLNPDGSWTTTISTSDKKQRRSSVRNNFD